MGHADVRLDALDIVAQDHAVIRELFDLYHDAGDDPRRRAQATDALLREIDIHGALETDLFYLALAETLSDGDRLRSAYEDHVEIMRLADEIRLTRPDTTAHATLVAALRRVTERHFAAEESELFASARAAGVDLRFLGEQLARRRSELAATHARFADGGAEVAV